MPRFFSLTSLIALDQDTVAKLVELDSIVDELQRANERVATVERRNELLRSEIERARSDSGETERLVASSHYQGSAISWTLTEYCLRIVNDRVKELRSHVKELEEEIAQMVDVTESARKERTAQEQQYQHQRETLERKLTGANEEIVAIRNELQLYRDYDEVKRELEILKVSLCTSHHDTRVYELNYRL
jgi:homeobox protein cut-like